MKTDQAINWDMLKLISEDCTPEEWIIELSVLRSKLLEFEGERISELEQELAKEDK